MINPETMSTWSKVTQAMNENAGSGDSKYDEPFLWIELLWPFVMIAIGIIIVAVHIHNENKKQIEKPTISLQHERTNG